MCFLFSERRDLIKTFERRAREKKIPKTDFFSKLAFKFDCFKRKLINEQIEETKNERSELKNFNRNFNAKKAEITTNVRMFMFSR